MVDGKPRIGDEVYIHGYIDEIRNDVIIIRNEGGYFGTSDREIFYYEEDERGYGTMNEADRKTEPQRNMAEDIVESFGFKAESYRQAKAKTEPQTEYRIGYYTPTNAEILRAIEDEPQTDCKTCKYGQDKHRYAHICNECGVGINNYTPQTERSE